MKDFLVEIRDWYDNSSVTLEKLALRLVILSVAFLSHVLIWLLCSYWGGYLYNVFVKYLGYPAGGIFSMKVEDSFLLIYIVSVMLFMIHVLIYTLAWLILKIKPHFDMIFSVALVTFILRDGFMDANLGDAIGWSDFDIAWNYAYALILLFIFCVAIVLSKYLPTYLPTYT